VRQLRVRTSELVPLEYRLAGLPERGLAWVVDEALVVTATSVVYFLASLFGLATAGLGRAPALGVAMVAGFVLEIGYRWWSEMRFRGRTIGKRLLGLRAVADDGTQMLPWQAFVRNAARVVDALPAFSLVGAVSVLVDPQSRRAGDRLAATVVVKDVVHAIPRSSRLPSEAENSLAQDAVATSRIRARVTRREATLCAEFVAAAPRMETARRLALAARIARSFRGRLGLDAHAALPDETLLRGIVGVIARDRFGAVGSRP